MGAYGAALYSMKLEKSEILDVSALESFEHTSKTAICHGCQNNCHLTVNVFSGGKKFISGNRCEKGLGLGAELEKLPNLHHFKRSYLTKIESKAVCAYPEATRGTVGLPLALGMYELLPLWYGIFRSLGFAVKISPMSSKATYEKGQFTIPSDTACYPAKLMHGHIEELVEMGVDAIFYPCITYNIDEGDTDNHYNCPVVAYYSELLGGNMDVLKKASFIYPYLNINRKKELIKELLGVFDLYFANRAITKQEIKRAVDNGFTEYNAYMDAVKREGEAAIKWARERGKRIMILAGRPYHIDSEVGHGIDKLANSLGFVVVSEDSVFHLAEPVTVNVLNQWTYHARLYRAARFARENPDVELVQLVSFGCGVDAITTDEVRSILEESGKFYTQIKIDEITNLGAVRIRLRSLMGALEQ
jgi:predicted nucleotide-binding protein (sugar kinase/HSP70/actin superfamily)